MKIVVVMLKEHPNLVNTQQKYAQKDLKYLLFHLTRTSSTILPICKTV